MAYSRKHAVTHHYKDIGEEAYIPEPRQTATFLLFRFSADRME